MKLKATQRAAAEQAWQAAGALLNAGAQGAGLVLVAELQRAVHSCRVAGLHRLAAAGTRVMQQVDDLHDQRPEFRLASLGWDVYQFLLVAHALRSATDVIDARWIGEARRGYAEVGDLRLTGLLTEAVTTTSGYAGAVTYLADASNTLWSLGDVAPGDVRRCRFAYVTRFGPGDASLQHRTLSRSGVELERATAAVNRRLGIGRATSAVTADGVMWWQPPLSSLWSQGLRAQLERAWSTRDEEERRTGDDLLFVRATIVGATANTLLLRAGNQVLHGVAPTAHTELAYRHNLDLLSRAAGLESWLIGRIVFARPRMVHLLAIGSPGLALPEDWCGRVNLGLDHLQPRHLPPSSASSGTTMPAEPSFDPLLPLARRLEQVLLAGRSAASAVATSGFVRDEAALARNQMPTAAQLLSRLREAPPEHLAEAWLAARLYLSAAEAKLQREAWLT